MIKSTFSILLVLAVFTLTACVNLKPRPDTSKLYTLGPVPSPTIHAGNTAAEGIYVARPDLPVYLEGAQLKYREPDGQLKSLPSARWAESLEDGLARALAENLAADATGIGVGGYYPWPYHSREMPKLHIQVHQLNAYADGSFRMVVQWHLGRGSGQTASGQFSSHDLKWSRGDAASLVAAINEGIRLLSVEIARAL